MNRRSSSALAPWPYKAALQFNCQSGALSRSEVGAERDHPGHQPLVPHVVDLALEVIDVIVREMREAPLLQ